MPRGTVDEVNWAGPTKRTAVAIHPRLLTDALDETAHETDIQLTEHWDLIDRHISALVLEMTADLDDGSPAGTIYGESLANALAVYLLKRYAVRRVTPQVFKGGLPGYRLKRVLDYIADNLDENISLSQIAAIAGMSPHHVRSHSNRVQVAFRIVPFCCKGRTCEAIVPNRGPLSKPFSMY